MLLHLSWEIWFFSYYFYRYTLDIFHQYLFARFLKFLKVFTEKCRFVQDSREMFYGFVGPWSFHVDPYEIYMDSNSNSLKFRKNPRWIYVKLIQVNKPIADFTYPKLFYFQNEMYTSHWIKNEIARNHSRSAHTWNDL